MISNIEKYQTAILNFMTEDAKSFVNKARKDGVNVELIIDEKNQRYQAILIGWRDDERYIYSLLYHLDIINGKVWLQHNGTETLIGDELIKRGIPKKDIVVGFHPPYARQLPGYEYGVA